MNYPILCGDNESICASNNRTANKEVRSEAKLLLHAGNEMILDPGFEGILGSEFSVYI